MIRAPAVNRALCQSLWGQMTWHGPPWRRGDIAVSNTPTRGQCQVPPMTPSGGPGGGLVGRGERRQGALWAARGCLPPPERLAGRPGLEGCRAARSPAGPSSGHQRARWPVTWTSSATGRERRRISQGAQVPCFCSETRQRENRGHRPSTLPQAVWGAQGLRLLKPGGTPRAEGRACPSEGGQS